MKFRHLAKLANLCAILALLSCSNDDNTFNGESEEVLSLNRIEANRDSINTLSGLTLHGTGFTENTLISLDTITLTQENLNDTTITVTFSTPPEGTYMLRAEDTNATDSMTLQLQAGKHIKWQGTLTTAPDTPELNWAYFNSNDRISYIFDGAEWQVLIVGGNDDMHGLSIIWLGELVAAPLSPALNWAYFNCNDRTSYIFNGTVWNRVAVSGENNTTLVNGTEGINGLSIVWQGEQATNPLNPLANWAYYNTTLKASLIFNGNIWAVLAKDGIESSDNLSITWLGALSTAPSSPKQNEAYYNKSDGNSYISDGSVWTILTPDDLKGDEAISVRWKGLLETPPHTVSVNNAYFNIIDQVSYIYSGTQWDTLSVRGIMGLDGTPIIWKGYLAQEPPNPSLNWTYFNTDEMNYFIFNGTTWDILSNISIDGLPLVWKGQRAELPENPSLNWAFFSTKERISFRYRETGWQTLPIQ